MTSRKWLYWNCLGSLSPFLRCATTGHRISAQTMTPTISDATTVQVQKVTIRSDCGVMPSGQPNRSTSLPEQPVAVKATNATRPAMLGSRDARERLVPPTARSLLVRPVITALERSREAQATPAQGHACHGQPYLPLTWLRQEGCAEPCA